MDPTIAPYLSYPRWVYFSRNSVRKPDELLKILEEEAVAASKYLEYYMYDCIDDNHSLLELCFSPPKVKDEINNTLQSLYKFALVNKSTLQMICEHLDKHYETKLFLPWLQNNQKRFKFNNGVILSRLNFEVHRKTIECPVCFENVDMENPCVILKCGHILCLTCLKNVYGIKDTRGTLNNMIKYRESYSEHPVHCPTCRFTNPCGTINKINVYPKKTII